MNPAAHNTGARLLTFGETMGLVSAERIGTLDVARRCLLGIGGAESNVAIGAARLGTRATWIGRIGPDAVGELIVRQLRADGVRTLAIRDEAFTGLMIRHRRTGAGIQIDYHRRGSAGSRLAPADVPRQEINRAGIVHLTGITPALSRSARQATFHAVDLAKAAGTLVSVDVNYRSKLWPPHHAAPVLRDLATRADIVFAGLAEAALLANTSTTDTAARSHALAALGPGQVIIKDGANGCHAIDGPTEHHRSAMPVPTVIDPIGAGDAFVAGFLAERLLGASLETCLDTALAMGAFAVSVPGDCELLPTRADLHAFTAHQEVHR